SLPIGRCSRAPVGGHHGPGAALRSHIRGGQRRGQEIFGAGRGWKSLASDSGPDSAYTPAARSVSEGRSGRGDGEEVGLEGRGARWKGARGFGRQTEVVEDRADDVSRLDGGDHGHET